MLDDKPGKSEKKLALENGNSRKMVNSDLMSESIKELERIGDIAEGICQFVLNIKLDPEKELLEKTRLLEMFETSAIILTDVMTAFEMEDTRLARSVFKKDEILDQINMNANESVGDLDIQGRGGDDHAGGVIVANAADRLIDCLLGALAGLAAVSVVNETDNLIAECWVGIEHAKEFDPFGIRANDDDLAKKIAAFAF